MQRTPRIRRALVAGALLIALTAVPAHAATPAAPTAKLAYTAKIMITTNVFKLPGEGHQDAPADARAVGRRPERAAGAGHAQLQGQDLAAGRAARTARMAPAAGSARISSASSTSSWRVTINRDSHLVTVYSNGRKLRSFSSVIGAPATPTPRGLYAIYEKLRAAEPEGLPRALGAAPHGVLGRAVQLRRRAWPRCDPRSRRREPGRSARVVALARVHPRGRREHRLDGARRPARHARSDHLEARHPIG